MKCCEHQDVYWYPCINEAGWKCLSCQKKGFDPELDREFLDNKVEGIIQDMQESKFVYFSNSSEGEAVVAAVCEDCEKLGQYDQYTIIMEIMKVCQPSHAAYWKNKQADEEKTKKFPNIDWNGIEADLK